MLKIAIVVMFALCFVGACMQGTDQPGTEITVTVKDLSAKPPSPQDLVKSLSVVDGEVHSSIADLQQLRSDAPEGSELASLLAAGGPTTNIIVSCEAGGVCACCCGADVGGLPICVCSCQ
jgi:hypothetical protein